MKFMDRMYDLAKRRMELDLSEEIVDFENDFTILKESFLLPYLNVVREEFSKTHTDYDFPINTEEGSIVHLFFYTERLGFYSPSIRFEMNKHNGMIRVLYQDDPYRPSTMKVMTQIHVSDFTEEDVDRTCTKFVERFVMNKCGCLED